MLFLVINTHIQSVSHDEIFQIGQTFPLPTQDTTIWSEITHFYGLIDVIS